MGHTLIQVPHSVQISSLTVTTSLIMLMAMTEQRSMHPPQPVHLLLSMLTILILLSVCQKINLTLSKCFQQRKGEAISTIDTPKGIYG
jgi:hypothetical protein